MAHKRTMRGGRTWFGKAEAKAAGRVSRRQVDAEEISMSDDDPEYDHVKLDRRCREAEAERDALKAMLREVVEEFVDVRGYVPAYFWEKWDYDDVVRKAKRLLGDA